MIKNTKNKSDNIRLATWLTKKRKKEATEQIQKQEELDKKQREERAEKIKLEWEQKERERKLKEEQEINQEFEIWKNGHPNEAESLSFWRKGIPFDIHVLDGYYDRLDYEPAANFIKKKEGYSFSEAVLAFDEIVAFRKDMSSEVKKELVTQCHAYAFIMSDDLPFPGEYEITYMFTDNVDVGAETREEIRRLLIKNKLHPLTGEIYGILTDELTGEQYDMVFETTGWGQCDDAATYGGISMKKIAEKTIPSYNLLNKMKQ